MKVYQLPVRNWHVPFDNGGDFILTQKFGENPQNYPGWAGHMGVDIAPAFNTPSNKWLDFILARGEVMAAGPDGNGDKGWGNWVQVFEDCDTFIREWIYAHHHEVNVKTGDFVEVGQLAGAIGTSGNSTGPHVHISTRDRDKNNPSFVLNYNNGYFGHYDPWPLIVKINETIMNVKTIETSIKGNPTLGVLVEVAPRLFNVICASNQAEYQELCSRYGKNSAAPAELKLPPIA